MSLDALFNQILLTEQKVSEQTKLLQDVKAAISKYQGKIKTTTEELNYAKNQLEEKCKVLTEYGLQMELLKKCSDSREKQREDLLTQQSQLQETSEETQRRAAEERDRFMEEIVSFNTEFNLLVDRRTVEENRARAEIEAMQKEEDSLNEEMEHMAQGNAGILSLQAERMALQRELSEFERRVEDVDTQLGEAEAVTNCLKAERATVSQRPSTDSAFLRLKSEVAELKEGEPSHVRQALRSEIELLKTVPLCLHLFTLSPSISLCHSPSISLFCLFLFLLHLLPV
ncbi:coiled-coil domain-containing protein 172 isoform X1 [Anguilla rostrata]|uniref:coiled-coil domain-containing protein 172 isoform X1 n=2 Tax=Anguilla rostrata TaxID=7938 RepID=UPI0030D3819D